LEAKRAKSAEDIDFVVKAQVIYFSTNLNRKILAGGRGMGYFKENNFQGGVHIEYDPESVI